MVKFRPAERVKSRHDVATGELTPRQRQIVGMHCCGWPWPEIARAMGIAEGTVAPVLRQASVRMGGCGIGRAVLRDAAIKTDNWTEMPWAT